jgi:transposase
MNELFSNRFEESLQKIEASLHKKGGIKRYDRVLMRIGRAQESYPSVHRFYRIDIEKDEKEVVTAMQWVKKQECDMDADSGTYFLRTSVERLDEKTTWDYYNLIREIEATFRCLKTDLDLRPIYHQKDESCEAHLFFWIALLLGGEHHPTSTQTKGNQTSLDGTDTDHVHAKSSDNYGGE